MSSTIQVAQPLLEVRRLRKEFFLRSSLLAQLLSRSREVVRAVDGVSFDIAAGEVLSLVGESGSGKTTLGRMVAMLEEPTAGMIRLNGTNITRTDRWRKKDLRRDVQMIFQNPYESIDPRYTVGAWVGQPLRFLEVGKRAEHQEEVTQILNAVGLRPASAYMDRLPHELSGGQRQRVEIARALAVKPRLMVADEPVSMLDASARSGILKLLLSLRDRLGVTYIFITHDLAIARYVSDRIAVMYLGKIVEAGPTETIVHQPAHPYTKVLLAAVPDPNPARRRERVRVHGEAAAVSEIPSGCRFHTRCPLAQPVCVEEAPLLLEIENGHQAACHFTDQNTTF